MQKPDKTGSTKSLVLIALAAVIVIVGAVVLLTAGGSDDGPVDESAPAPESQPAVDEPVDESGGDDGGESGPAETVSRGDYTIANVSELVPVCASNSFPSGVVSTPSGKKTTAFVQQEVGGDYEYSSAAIGSGTGLFPGYSTNEVDLVACFRATGTESFQVACEGGGTNFDLVGYEFDVDVYRIQSGQKLGSAKLSHSMKCPVFAALIDGKADANNVDRDSLTDYINSL